MQFVWVYWHGGARNDELRWSIRSVIKNYLGTAKILVVGDKPPWYNGPHLRVKRVKPGKYRAFRDSLNKLIIATASKETDEEFVWMMDDIYINRPVGDAVLKAHYYQRVMTSERLKKQKPKNKWQRLKIETFKRLESKGKPMRDYGTHLPQFVEKSKFKAMVRDFDPSCAKRLMLWEVLYGNLYSINRLQSQPLLLRVAKKSPYQTFTTSKKLFINNGNYAWNEALRGYLFENFPEQTEVECLPAHPPREWYREKEPTPQPIQSSKKIMVQKPKCLISYPLIWGDRTDRVGAYTRAMNASGLFSEVISCTATKENVRKHIGECAIWFNHTEKINQEVTRNIAKDNLDTKIVNVNHSALSWIPYNDRKVRDTTSSIWSARSHPNIWYADQEDSKIGEALGLDRYQWLPCPIVKIDPRAYKKPGESFNVFMGGRDCATKNHLTQLLALKLSGIKFNLHLCLKLRGQNLKFITHALGVPFTAHGILPHREWISLLREKADFVMNCSTSESYCVVAADANQLGVPCLVGASGYRPADPELICDAGRVESISDGIKRLVVNHKRYSARAIRFGEQTEIDQRTKYIDGVRRILES